MSRRRILQNIFGFVCTAILIVSGIMVPSILLHKHDSSIIGQSQIFRPNEQGALFTDVVNTDNVTSEYNELESRMQAWDNAHEMYARAPYTGEWMLEQAADQCLSEISSLAGEDVFSFVNTADFIFSNAVLYTKKELASTDNARWSIEFVGKAQGNFTLTVWMDARTGMLYSIEIICQDSPKDVQSLLEGYAAFYGISVRDEGNGRLISEDSHIQIQGAISVVCGADPAHKVQIEMSFNNSQ